MRTLYNSVWHLQRKTNSIVLKLPQSGRKKVYYRLTSAIISQTQRKQCNNIKYKGSGTYPEKWAMHMAAVNVAFTRFQ